MALQEAEVEGEEALEETAVDGGRGEARRVVWGADGRGGGAGEVN